MFLLVPAYPGCPGQTAVKWLLLLSRVMRPLKIFLGGGRGNKCTRPSEIQASDDLLAQYAY